MCSISEKKKKKKKKLMEPLKWNPEFGKDKTVKLN